MVINSVLSEFNFWARIYVAQLVGKPRKSVSLKGLSAQSLAEVLASLF